MAWLIRLANGMQLEVEGNSPLAPEDRAEIEARFNSPIASTKAADQRNADATAPLSANSTSNITERQVATLDVAIVGMSGRFPGANSIDEFWKLLAEGKDPIREIPSSRWSLDQFYDPRPAIRGKTNSRWSGLLDDIEGFDAGLFGVAPREAQYIDPQHRLLLESCWELLEHAGYGGRALTGTDVGVFIGASANEYSHRFLGHPRFVERYLGSGNALSMIANRLSFQFDFKGPSLTIDTACSSSLVAVHLACRSLANGECQVAIAGGVNVLLAPEMYVNCSQARMLAGDGRSKTFDRRADGYVRSEGVGLVLLKPLEVAVAAGDMVHAIIRATGVNQDGRTSGLTVPNGAAQAELLRRIYCSGGVSVDSISYLEAHGTGTGLGDPIEVAAASGVLGAAGRRQHCAIGSLKSNVGHLEAAAGIASLIKVALALRHQQLPPTLHFAEPNEHIRFEESPFYVVDQLTTWHDLGGTAKRAGISAFGFGGTNAHVVIEEPATVPSESLAPRPELFVLSARSPATLQQLVVRYACALRELLGKESDNSIRTAALADTCFTLLAGRAQLPCRLAIAVGNSEDLINALASIEIRESVSTRSDIGASWALGLPTDDSAFTAVIDDARRQLAAARTSVLAMIAKLARGSNWEELFASALQVGDGVAAMPVPLCLRHEVLQIAGTLFVAGVDFNWDELFAGESRRRLPLPTYPFDRKRYWIDSFGSANQEVIIAPTRSLEQEVASAGLLNDDSPKDPFADHYPVNLPTAVAQCCYVQRWVEAQVGAARRLPDGVWLLMLDELGVAERMRVVLERQGLTTVALQAKGRFDGLKAVDTTGLRFDASIEPGSRADYQRLLAAIANTGRPLVGVIHAWLLNAPASAFAGEPTDERLDELVAKGPNSLLALAQFVADAQRGTAIPPAHAMNSTERSPNSVPTMDRNPPLELWLLTAGPALDPAGGEFNPIDPAGAALRAYGEVMDLEFVEFSVRHVGLPTDVLAANELADAVCRELLRERASYSVALASRSIEQATQRSVLPTERYAPVMIPYNPVAIQNARRFVDPAATYLITGGLGYLGLQYARALVEDGARFLVLLSRTGAPEELPNRNQSADGLHDVARQRLQALHELRAKGADIRVVAGDVADVDFVDGLIDEIDRHPSRLGGLVHAAGVLKDGLICTRSDCDLADVLRPKVWGAEAISRAVTARRPDWVHFCSSTASIKAESGHAAYAAANAYLDAVGHRLRQRGIACTVLNWGPWAGAPSAASSGYRRLMARRGTSDLHPAVAMAAFRHAIQANEQQLAVVNLHASQRERLLAVVDEIHGAGTLFELRWQAAAEIAARARTPLKTSTTQPSHAAAAAVIDLCCSEYIENLLANAGLFRAAGELSPTQTIIRRLSVAPHLEHALLGLLLILVDDELLSAANSGFIARRAFQVRNPGLALRKLGSQFPMLGDSLGLLERCGAALSEILAGRRDVLELLFAAGSRHELRAVYSQSPWNLPLQDTLGQVLAAAASYATGAKPFSILEVGAGTGGTTSHLFSRLTAGTFRYTFSDVSPRLVHDAQQEFSRPEFQFAPFDLERPISEQRFSERSFDAIVAADVVHATSRVDAALEQLARLLVPGGLLLLYEATRTARFAQLTFGLTAGWWRFRGDFRRAQGPLLAPCAWLAALRDHGFDPAIAIPGVQDEGGPRDHHLIVARSPRSIISCSSGSASMSPVSATARRSRWQDGVDNRAKPLETTDQQIWIEPLQQTLSDVLQLPISELDPRRPFHEQGLDSLMVLEVIEALRTRYRVPDLSPTFFFEHPTLVDFAAALLQRFGTPERCQDTTDAGTQPLDRSRTEARVFQNHALAHLGEVPGRGSAAEPIAIVGFACKLPGADSAGSYWDMLCNATSVVGPIGADRFRLAMALRYDDSLESLRDSCTNAQGGFLPDVASFDPLFFHISPREASFIDPRQRLFLETAYHALEHAGYGGAALCGMRCGTFVGCGPEDYLNDRSSRELGEFWATGTSPATLASRLAYFLDLRGPAVPVDTACSSSL
ncbi:MAG: SDR family NAD(P)-dependent oxidoreductase, partial [Pirellulales bacterium]|nr:SDR family NAD(P)-dependent oxidoreductase [Pirellulales bacterium]